MEHTPEPPGALPRNIQELLTESDNETSQFCFEEEMIEEVMQEFYNEIAGSFVTPPPEKPSSSPPLMDEGKNGSCGASVSDSTSTVMAGIEIVSSAGKLPAGRVEAEADDEGEGVELDDEWLGRVLSWEQGQLVESRLWF